jgi:hypothetical protein
MLNRTLRGVSALVRRAPALASRASTTVLAACSPPRALSTQPAAPLRFFSNRSSDQVQEAEYTEIHPAEGASAGAGTGESGTTQGINFDIEVAVAIREEIVECVQSPQVKGLLETLAHSSDLQLAKWRTVETVIGSLTEQIIADYQAKDPAFPLKGSAAVAAVNFDTLCRVVALSDDGRPLREAWENQWVAVLSAAYGTDEFVTRNAKIAPEQAQRLGFMYNQFTQHETFKTLLAEKLNAQAIAQSGPTASGAVRALEQKQRTRALTEVLDPFLTRLYAQFGFEGNDGTGAGACR